MSYCIVSNCAHPGSHTVKGHRCRKCHAFGHGLIEHGDSKLMDELEQKNCPKIPDDFECKIKGCRYKDSHITTAHCCGMCRDFGHGVSNHCVLCTTGIHDEIKCDKYSYLHQENDDTTYNFIRQMFPQLLKNYSTQTMPLYSCINVGMGCSVYARRYDKISKFEFIFIHSDDYSYDPDCDKKIEDFIQSHARTSGLTLRT